MDVGAAKRWARVLVFALALLIVVVIFSKRKSENAARPETPPHPSVAPAIPLEPLIGQQIMPRYAEPEVPAEEDLTSLAHAMENFALLVKGNDPLPLGANEEIAAALRGKNKAKFRALPDDSRAFNAAGQLVDRWGSPLFFHANSRDRIDIRSAGPDRRMWTTDDLHRRADGQFLRGEALSAPSLFEVKPRR